ncbi:hypothetical protein MPLSOD_10134 [Mesorhizobium sp. SOD10]|nr:hypothetical protein MPLSOD_10134 [Mesorhizobium sp. SOD10]
MGPGFLFFALGKFAPLSRMVWFSRTGAERTTVREQRMTPKIGPIFGKDHAPAKVSQHPLRL